MANPKHFIVVGRVSKDTGEKLVHRFGRDNIIQSRYGTHSDGEATFELFLDGKLDDHPLEQNLTIREKETIRSQLKGAHVTIVHSVSGQNTSSRALSLIQSIQSLTKDHEVGSITLIAPHMGLTRSDRKFLKKAQVDGIDIVIRQDNARGNAIMAHMIRSTGADRMVGIDFHSNDSKNDYKKVFDKNYDLTLSREYAVRGLHRAGVKKKDILEATKELRKIFKRTQKTNPVFPHNGALFISAVDILVPHLKSVFNTHAHFLNIRIGAPDGANKPKDSGIGRAREASAGLVGYTDDRLMFKIAKERKSPTETVVIPEQSYAEVQGKICVLVDDIVNSGSTQIHAAEFLREKGASKIIAYATHAVLVGDNLRKLLENNVIDEVWVTDTVPGIVEKWEKLKRSLTRDRNILPEERERLIGKFTILPAAELILDQVAKDHGARIQTCPNLVWANENPGTAIKFPELAA